jgi:tetratricopeptide (TPR) repeat protein
MAGRQNRLIKPALLVLLPGLVLGLALVVLLPRLWSGLLANIERVRSLRGLELPVYERSLDEAAWDAGWRSLCAPGGAETPYPVPASERALQFSALASMDRGDYAAARALLRRLVDAGLAGDEPNGLAYLAALEMDWIGAARAYEPQGAPRHERWWGTVFYLAAQQRMFNGALDEAADLYRRADAAYGVHGPYLGLGLVECFVREGRLLEAWDAYRRALVVMPPQEALAHLARFEELRLEGLRAWRERDPANEQVAHWLAFYEADSWQELAGAEVVQGEPQPMVPVEANLEGGQALLGFDYRVEDLETGPFMVADFYLREGRGEPAEYRRVRQVVLNQAPNGAFAWDAAPDGVRPVGWHGLVYSHDLAAIEYGDVGDGGRWLCMDGGAIREAFGLQSALAVVPTGASIYLQSGQAYVTGGGTLAHGRRWFGAGDATYPYSYLGGGYLQDQVQGMSGTWVPDDGTETVAVWLFSMQVGQACARNVYLFPVMDLEHAE